MRSRATQSERRAEVSITEEVPPVPVQPPERPSAISRAGASVYEDARENAHEDEEMGRMQAIPGNWSHTQARRLRRTPGSRSDGNCVVQ